MMTQFSPDDHLAFIGKILSLYTHEQKNHLAIINESAGLLGDMIEFSETLKSLPETGQILDIIKSIDAQIKRSSEMAKALNSFGHRMDTALCLLSVNDCVKEVLALLHRALAQKRITIEGDYAADMAAITGSPSTLQLLVFKAVTRVAEENAHINIKTFNTDDSAIISITPGIPVDFMEDSDYFKPMRAVTINGREINIIIPLK
ncbi:hypothetical protein [Candidatus Magnetominusculus dajiuhuensis]|uniref:hypothetical protein n=1 Tax=Candidatus Magnetominusculus dajiuhuensis TaxID=3137712 RepID=UPI003B432FE0